MARSVSRHQAVVALAAVALMAVGFSLPSYAAHTMHATRASMSHHVASGNKVMGQIESVNPDSKVLTVKERGKEVQLTWTDDTKVELKSGKAKPVEGTASDLKAGERITAVTQKGADGNLMAKSIWIRQQSSPSKTGTMKG